MQRQAGGTGACGILSCLNPHLIYGGKKMEEIVNAISTVGFPIVCTLILGYILIQEQKAHKQEMLELRASIENNTLIMAELKQLLYDISQLKKDGD